MGQVTPLFKKNDELSKENYRHVTVLTALNVFEKLLATRLDQLYSEILSDYISAYRRHYSCETSLMSLTEDWRRSLDNKQIVAVISMDLSKAFDTIPHGLSLAKLKTYGVNSRSCMLLKDEVLIAKKSGEEYLKAVFLVQCFLIFSEMIYSCKLKLYN